jgi:TPR repeat protein
VEAMHAVGSFYYWGEGVDQDFAKARHWYRKSAKLGYADGMCDLGRCYQIKAGGRQNQRLAIHWLQKSTQAGCLRAQSWLGLAYASEPLLHWDKARYWLEKAAENGQANAMFFLGMWADSGWTGPENSADALFWFSKAAQLGHQRAALREAELRGEEF